MIKVNLDKAKAIAHNIRREARLAELDPLDKRIALAIPGDDAAAVEAQRQEIRDRYAAVQTKIDAANVAGLHKIVAEIRPETISIVAGK